MGVDESKPMIRPSIAAVSSEGVSGGCGGSQDARKQSPNTDNVGSRGWYQGPHFLHGSAMWILGSRGWLRGLFPLHGSAPYIHKHTSPRQIRPVSCGLLSTTKGP